MQWEIKSKQYLQALIKWGSKVQENNMSWKRSLDFDKWKTFSENYKAMRISSWLIYKFTENNCRLPCACDSEFIQTQKRHPTSIDKISIPIWKLFASSSQKLSCELYSQRTYSLQNISHLSLRLLYAFTTESSSIKSYNFLVRNMALIWLEENVQRHFIPWIASTGDDTECK